MKTKRSGHGIKQRRNLVLDIIGRTSTPGGHLSNNDPNGSLVGQKVGELFPSYLGPLGLHCSALGSNLQNFSSSPKK